LSSEEGEQGLRLLIERFAANEPYFRTRDFDETSTREQFINPLFDLLGWDLLDAAGHGPDREVVFHPRLVEHSQAAGAEEWDEDLTEEELAAREPVALIPDYAFRVDGVTRFFVEAKRAGVSVDTRAPAFQVKSYAWSQRGRVAVLTNFRQLRVFETTARPVYNQADAGLLIGVDYTEFEANWERLWNLLSREAVIAGSVERAGRQRRGALRVDEAFLNELAGWRERLARDLATRNPDLDVWGLGEATQRILDRLVFLRVCEDRTVEQQVVLRRYARVTDAYRQLRTEFGRLNLTYNGALFAPHFSERLEVSDEVIQAFIESLYFPYSPYRFDVIDVDLLGSVYERFLGQELTLDSHRHVDLVDKPEVRHSGGVYYTPKWVVQQIVERTIGPLLADRTPRAAEQLRIVDPACGSGSFLLGALDYLISWHEEYYTANPDADRDRHRPGLGDRRLLTSDAKASIVSRNLFGVDIDPQAVEVAQMSLYLKILERETGASLHEQHRLFAGPYLPALTENIRSGNSLLAPGQVPDQLLFDVDLRRRINPFDWHDTERGFGAVFTERGGFDAVIGNPPYTRVQVLRRFRREESALYAEAYSTAAASFDIATLFIERGLSLLRPSRGRDRGGRLGYIVTRTFCETDAAAPLRELLAAGRRVNSITDFGAGLVFEGVSAYTVLLNLTREPNPTFKLTRVPAPPSLSALVSAELPNSPLAATISAAELDAEPWPLMLPVERALLDRLAAAHPSLRAVSGDQIFQGVITGADPIYRCADVGPHPSDPSLRLVKPPALERPDPIAIEREVLRPVVAGANDLHRFRWAPSNEWIIFPYERNTETEAYQPMSAARFGQRFPLAYAWLNSHREALLARSPQTGTTWSDQNWPAFSRRQNLERFAEPKVLVPYMLRELCAAPDPGAHYFVNVTTGGYGIGLNPEYAITREYLAALLNSELCSWALRRRSRAFRGDYFAGRASNLRLIPIAITANDTQNELVAAYERCVQAAGATDTATGEHDEELTARIYDQSVRSFDDLVFGLYGITDDERRVIRSG
jgi:hypothetical protein